jgi:hypothetical protein
MVLREAVSAAAAALHEHRGHRGDWRQEDHCDCLSLSLTAIQAASAVLGDYMERQRALLEGRPPGPVPGAPARPPERPPPPRPRWALRDGPDRSRRRRR